jgi:hypothetical protein
MSKPTKAIALDYEKGFIILYSCDELPNKEFNSRRYSTRGVWLRLRSGTMPPHLTYAFRLCSGTALLC